MAEQTLLGHFFVFRARTAVVGVGVDADAATRSEESCHLNIFGVHEADEIFHDGVDTVLMEIAVVAEREEVELQALRLDHPFARHIENLYLSEVWLTGDRTEGCELWAVKLHPVVVLRVFVLEGFEYFRSIVGGVLRFAAQLLQAFLFAIVTHSLVLLKGVFKGPLCEMMNEG